MSLDLNPTAPRPENETKPLVDRTQTNPMFKRLLDSLTAYRSDSYQWLQVAELSFDSFMMRMRTRA